MGQNDSKTATKTTTAALDPVVAAEQKLTNLRANDNDAKTTPPTQPRGVAESDEESDFSFNFNSESSEEEIKFPTSTALTVPAIEVPDPLVNIDTPTKRVAKDFISTL